MRFIGTIEVDSAVSMADTEWVDINGENGIKLNESDEYRYVGFIDQEDGICYAVCSKNNADWSICVGAKIGGHIIDLRKMSEMVKDIHEEGEFEIIYVEQGKEQIVE